MISQGHWYYLFLKKDDELLLRRLVGLFGCVAMLHELSSLTEAEDIWKRGEREYGSALPMVYVAFKKADIHQVGYTIMDGLVDPLSSPSAMPEAMVCPWNVLA